MFDIITKIFRRSYPSKVDLRKYSQDFFVDPTIQEEIILKGFAVRRLLDGEQIKKLKSDFDEIHQRDDHEIGEQFWNSGRAKSTIVRNMARKSINENVYPNLQTFFQPEKADLMGGVFVVKPPTDKSELNPHQDSSHVEEDKFLSVYAWCTLIDTTIYNGALHFIPGSHLFGNAQRSLNVPWQFAPFTDILWQYAQPVEMKAGEVVFFDSATIHCSPANFANQFRVAVNFFIKQRSADFLHYYVGEETQKGKVEKFLVDMDFYYDKDFEKRPSSEYPKKEDENYIDLRLTRKKVERLCKQYRLS